MILTENDIKQKVNDLAKQIYFDYKDKEDIYFIYLLDGAFIFAADLARELYKLGLPLVIGSLMIKTYTNTKSTMNPIIKPSFNFSIKDKMVLIVEDILDTGNTLNIVKQAIWQQKPKSVDICVLLKKKKLREFNPIVKYVGFEIEDKFIVGYGLDLNNLHRERPYISGRLNND